METADENIGCGVIELESGNTALRLNLIEAGISFFNIVAKALSISDTRELQVLWTALLCVEGANT